VQTILGIVASPRKLGNCDILVKQIARELPFAHELNLVRLCEFNITACQACYRCLFGKQRCVLKDDFQALLEAVLAADGFILAAPTYLLGANAALKLVIDRGLSFYAHIETLWGKPAVGVCIAGIQGMEGHGLLGVENFLRMLLTDLKDRRVIYGALPGEIFLNEANRQVARQLALALAGQAQPEPRPRCPFCGGDTFRFLGQDRVRCMVCSNPGTMTLTGQGPVFAMEKGEHPMILSKQDVIEHREWLQGMKARFIENKEVLKSVCTDYLKEGNWIRPSGKDGV